jgi:hypothetical protein
MPVKHCIILSSEEDAALCTLSSVHCRESQRRYERRFDDLELLNGVKVCSHPSWDIEGNAQVSG